MTEARRLSNIVRAILLTAGLTFGMTLVTGAEMSVDERLQQKEVAVTAARGVMDDFMTTFNARDEVAWADTFNYPHIRIAGGKVRISETLEDITAEMDFELFAKTFGWHHSAWNTIELVQAGKDKVHFAVVFTRYDEAGKELKTYQSLYVVTLRDGHWGIQSRSSFAP